MFNSDSDTYVINHYEGLTNVRIILEIVILNDKKDIY